MEKYFEGLELLKCLSNVEDKEIPLIVEYFKFKKKKVNLEWYQTPSNHEKELLEETKEKVTLFCGNVAGVASVNDQMSVDQSVDESQYYTVESGDNLSKISKEFYDTPNKYMAIFEANQPMLSHPDKIYPGQLLRIPAEA